MTLNTTIRLADGTIYENSNCGYDDGYLWCFLKDVSLVDAFMKFSEPENTKTIIYMAYDEKERIYDGFTELTAVKKSEFTTDVRLRRPVETE